MKHRLVTTVTLAALACAVVAAAATAGGKGRLYQFRGELLAASSSSVQVQVEAGNRPALRALLGQAQDQTFAVGTGTEILVWQAGVPHVASTADLKQGDWVTVSVHAKGRVSLSDLEASPAGTVADRSARPNPPARPLYLYVGTVAGAQAGGHIALHVKAGNHRALRSLIGQSADQTFSYDDGTIFLLWQGKVPTVIDASQLQAGDRITIRIRAPRAATLAQVESTPAAHVGDHEPGNPANEN
jgi:hypothetical protein